MPVTSSEFFFYLGDYKYRLKHFISWLTKIFLFVLLVGSALWPGLSPIASAGITRASYLQ